MSPETAALIAAHSGSAASTAKKPMSMTTWLIIGAGILVAFFLLRGRSLPKPPVVNLDEEDYDLLDSNDPQGAADLLSNDTSPVFFTAGSGMTVADYIAVGEKITTKWADRMASISSTMDAQIPVMGAGLGYILASQPGSISEKAIDIWLRLLEQYCSMHRNAVQYTASTIADVAVAALEGVEKATTCAEWTFVKETIDESQYNVTTDISVSESGKASSALWGAFGSGKSSKTVTTHIEEMTHESRIVRYIPYCTTEVLDPTQLDAILAIQNIAMQTALANMIAVTKQYPDVKYFFKTVAP